MNYGRHEIDEADIQAVIEALRSDWLTTGPKVEEFEQALADFTRSKQAVAVSHGAAALHCAMHALGIGPGDEVIVPAITFVATANCVVYQGASPVFADIDPATLLIDPADVEARITPRTRAIIGMDYAGQPCDYDALRKICDRNGLALVADACHSLGAGFQGRPSGSLADLNCFSFHPVKAITTGEGGAVTTNHSDYAARIRRFRNQGLSSDHRQRQKNGSWQYEMVELGFNYRVSDIQCALGLSQLKKLPAQIRRRRQIARIYDQFLKPLPYQSLAVRAGMSHAYHLYVIRVPLGEGPNPRDALFHRLGGAGIQANVHYKPVYFHPYYQAAFRPPSCPRAEAAYAEILSLPMFPRMTETDVKRVLSVL